MLTHHHHCPLNLDLHNRLHVPRVRSCRNHNRDTCFLHCCHLCPGCAYRPRTECKERLPLSTQMCLRDSLGTHLRLHQHDLETCQLRTRCNLQDRLGLLRLNLSWQPCQTCPQGTRYKQKHPVMRIYLRSNFHRHSTPHLVVREICQHHSWYNRGDWSVKQRPCQTSLQHIECRWMIPKPHMYLLHS